MIRRVGPYEILGGARSVPGARFFEGRGPTGDRVTLQIVFLRGAQEEGTSAEIHRMKEATRLEVEGTEVDVEAHGSSFLSDGRALVYWALPGTPPPFVEGPLDPSRLYSLAEGLTSRLIDTHERGARAGLLTEAVVFEGLRGAGWYGVSVVSRPARTAAGSLPPRLSPLEDETLSERGDLWRLGATLASLSPPEVVLGGPLGDWLLDLSTGAFGSAEDAWRGLMEKGPPPRAPALLRDAPPENGRSHPTAHPPAAGPQGEGALHFDTGKAFPRRTPQAGMSRTERAAVADVAPSWSDPSFSPHESPWSDVEGGVRTEPEPTSGVRLAPIRRRFFEPSPGTNRASRRERWRPALLSLLFSVCLGAVAFVSRAPFPGQAPTKAFSAKEVRLRTEPPGAKVVAFRDGRLLGETPLDFLVPEGLEARVVTFRDGFEPVELDLSGGGALTVLLQAANAHDRCHVALPETPTLQVLVSGTVVPGGVSVKGGAAVIRPQEGSRVVGARVLLCPSPSQGVPHVEFASLPEPRRVRVVSPVGAKVRVDGVLIGLVPAETLTRSSFVRVELDGGGPKEARWVPVDAQGVEVHMPLSGDQLGLSAKIAREGHRLVGSR